MLFASCHKFAQTKCFHVDLQDSKKPCLDEYYATDFYYFPYLWYSYL